MKTASIIGANLSEPHSNVESGGMGWSMHRNRGEKWDATLL